MQSIPPHGLHIFLTLSTRKEKAILFPKGGFIKWGIKDLKFFNFFIFLETEKKISPSLLQILNSVILHPFLGT